jgi:hypothetical protein
MAFTQKLFTSYQSYSDGDIRVGQKNRIWYDSISNTFRISDGETPGGITIGGGSGGGSYTLPTASTTIKGGVKVDGSTITIANQVISGFSGSYTDLTNKPAIPSLTGYATETYVTTRGYLTSVGTISYTDLSNKPTLFSGSYTDLTDKPTIPSLAGYATETFVTSRGYLTSIGTISYDDLTNKPAIPSLTGYATQSYVTSQGYITSSALTGYALINQIPAAYTLPTASSTVLGGIKLGTGLNIDANGVVNVTGGGGSADLTGYATESYVTSQNYITSSALTGYATQTDIFVASLILG